MWISFAIRNNLFHLTDLDIYYGEPKKVNTYRWYYYENKIRIGNFFSLSRGMVLEKSFADCKSM